MSDAKTCRKTVIYTTVFSSFSMPYLNVSENCQKNQPDWYLTVFVKGNVSLQLYRCVRNVSLDSFLTDFYPECFLKMFHGFCKNESVKCHKWYFWQISDSFQKVEMTAFWHILKFWYISDPFPNSFLDNSDTFLQLTDFWRLYDRYLTYIWQSFVTDCFLTDF